MLVTSKPIAEFGVHQWVSFGVDSFLYFRSHIVLHAHSTRIHFSYLSVLWIHTASLFTTPGVSKYDTQNLKNTVLRSSPNPITRTRTSFTNQQLYNVRRTGIFQHSPPSKATRSLKLDITALNKCIDPFVCRQSSRVDRFHGWCVDKCVFLSVALINV